MAKRFPWKSNYRGIPAFVTEALDQIEGRLIEVAATKKIPRTEIDEGQYVHVGLRVDHGRVVASGPVSPLADASKWSERNAFGWDRKRHDRPMVPRRGPSNPLTSVMVLETDGRCGRGPRTFINIRFSSPLA